MNTVHIRLYDLFRKNLNLPNDQAAAFVDAVEEVFINGLKNEKQALSTKDDIHKLELKIEQTKSDLYKAIFWTSMGQLLAILGGVLAIIKFIKE